MAAKVNTLFNKQVTSNYHSSSEHFFKQKCLDFLLHSEDYKAISIQMKTAPLTFQTYPINWKTKSAINLVKNLSIPETVQTLYLLKLDEVSESWKWDLDAVLASKMQQCGVQEGLILAYAYLLVSPTSKPHTPLELNKSVFYKNLLKRMSVWIKSTSSPKHLVLIAYLGGLSKSNQEAMWRLRELYDRFKIHLRLFKPLKIDEVAIICNSWFKANIVITSRPLLRIMGPLLITELNTNGPTPNALPLLKVMRRANFSTDELLHSVAMSLTSESVLKLNVALVAHTLAMLADQNFPVSDTLVKNVINVINANENVAINKSRIFHPTEAVREKDITRLIWSLSCVVSDETHKQEIASKMINLVDRYLSEGLFKQRDHLLLDFFLSLATWQVYPQHLIKPLVTESFIHKFLSEQIPQRHWQLALFIWMARLEVPHLNLPWSCYATITENLAPFHPQYELKKRKYLGWLYETIRSQAAEEGWEDVQCASIIPHINIAGITFNSGR